MRTKRPSLTALGLAILAGLAPPALHRTDAATDPSVLCLEAATAAADRTGVPRDVLVAIALVETGQSRNGKLHPWPWTVNQGGEGRWFATKAEAAAAAQAALDLGASNVDLGCFQLNHRWHAEHFASLSDMLDPARNALYAAEFLARLYGDTGTWSDAAAAYHSRTPEYAARYQAKFDRTLAALGGAPVHPAAAEPDAQPNRFPLLLAGQPGRFGSLVPASQATGRLIGAP